MGERQRAELKNKTERARERAAKEIIVHETWIKEQASARSWCIHPIQSFGFFGQTSSNTPRVQLDWSCATLRHRSITRCVCVWCRRCVVYPIALDNFFGWAPNLRHWLQKLDSVIAGTRSESVHSWNCSSVVRTFVRLFLIIFLGCSSANRSGETELNPTEKYTIKKKRKKYRTEFNCTRWKYSFFLFWNRIGGPLAFFLERAILILGKHFVKQTWCSTFTNFWFTCFDRLSDFFDHKCLGNRINYKFQLQCKIKLQKKKKLTEGMKQKIIINLR